eukprot:1637337-Pyramimonas_sp.AAC.1
MDLELMIRQAMDLRVPSVELYLCCLTYLAPRVVTANGALAEAIVPNRPIVPGCGKANQCARVFRQRPLERAREKAPTS